jgi:ribosomal protein L37AE/L43A
MLAIQNSLQRVGNPIIDRPACPSCGRPMHLARTAPRTDGLADLRIYRCGECGVSLTEASEDGTAAYPG